MPVFFTWGEPDDIARPNFVDWAARPLRTSKAEYND
jgi:hypothetical protein